MRLRRSSGDRTSMQRNWGLGEDLLIGFGAEHHTNVRHSVARGRDVHALLLDRENTPLPVTLMKVKQQLPLRLRVFFFTHASLHDSAIHVIAIRIVSVMQVFFYRYQIGHRAHVHDYTSMGASARSRKYPGRRGHAEECVPLQ